MRFKVSVHVLKDPDASVSSIDKDNFILYPNPSNNKITIKSKTGIPINNIQIFDVSGRLVYNQSDINQNMEMEIDINSFKTGMYYCKILTSNESVSMPFIKRD